MPQPPACKRTKSLKTNSSGSSSYDALSVASSKAKDEYTLVAIKKSKEDSSKPLPDPFPLPLHYRPDVEACLKQGRMTATAKTAYFSEVAGAMFQFKRFPSRDEKVSVAKQLWLNIPFLLVPLDLEQHVYKLKTC